MLEASPWSVAQVMSGQEVRFRDEVLEAQCGVGAYVPLRRDTVWEKRPRRWKTKVRPLIAGYVILHTPQRVSDYLLEILSPFSRPRLLRRADGSPAPVAPDDVERLRADEIAKIFDDNTWDVSLRFVRGQVHVVKCGLLAGLRVTVARTPRPGAQKADFLVDGRKYSIPLSLFVE